MKLLQWSYTRRYQIKAVFDQFPDTVMKFRLIGGYYFLFTSTGVIAERFPTRRDYLAMELLINRELGSLPAYLARKHRSDARLVDELLQEGLPG